MTEDLEVRQVDLTQDTRRQVKTLRETLDDLTADELHAAILWSEAIAAAGKAKRAWQLAREASELKIRAERQLGEFINRGISHDEMMQLLTNEGTQSPGRPIEVNPEIADRARELHGEGLSFSAIARKFNEQSIPSPREGSWHPSGIRRIVLWGQRRSLLDPRDEGAYSAVACIPDELFEQVVSDLLDRGKSVDPRTILRISRQQSLEYIEPGISRSWDGLFYTSMSGVRPPRRSKKKNLEEVREELYEEERLTKKSARSGPAKLLDEAFAEARRDAQALNQLRETIGGEIGDIIAEAELLQAKVASLLFDAYRQRQIREKELRPFRMPK